MAGQGTGTTKLEPKNDLDSSKQSSSKSASTGSNNPTQHTGYTLDCDADIDWETVAEYLSQCQAANTADHVAVDCVSRNDLLIANTQSEARRTVDDAQRAITKRLNPSKSLILPRTPVVASTPSPTSNIPENAGLSTGAKAGIAGGIAIGIVIVLATLITLHTRRRRKKSGYSRTKGKDSMAAELDGHFVVTTWPDHGEASPMIKPVHARRASEANIGLGLERLPSQQDLHHEVEERSVEYNEERYVISPGLPNEIQGQHSNIHSPTPQAYQPSPLLNRSPSPELEQDPYEQHNQRARPSHPLAQLSEAIPPPKLEKRQVHVMADYQNAVPLGYANGFVQVGHTEVTPDTPTRTWESIQPTCELDLGERFNRGRASDEDTDAERGLIQAAEEDRAEDEAQEARDEGLDRVEGDTELPQYEEMPGLRKQEEEVVKHRHTRENVRWNQSTGHYHIDSESEDDGEGTSSNARRELTKEELG